MTVCIGFRSAACRIYNFVCPSVVMFSELLLSGANSKQECVLPDGSKVESYVFDRCTGLIINNNNITKQISANNFNYPNMLLVIR